MYPPESSEADVVAKKQTGCDNSSNGERERDSEKYRINDDFLPFYYQSICGNLASWEEKTESGKGVRSRNKRKEVVKKVECRV